MAIQRVNLVMFNPNAYGGTVTYTAHLYHALTEAGCVCTIYRLGGSTTHVSSRKPFGYGCEQISCGLNHLNRILSKGITLITACIGKEYEEPTLDLFNRGAFLTIHDPNDLGNFVDRSFITSDRIIIIRPNNTAICRNATFIPHPFKRINEGLTFSHPRPKHAVTLSRLGAIKRTKWVVEANRELPQDKQIWLRGYDDRFFTYNMFVRTGKYPEFKQDSDLPPEEKKTFAKELGEAQRIASQATYLVDLTEIKGDGGGTQYAFFEGMDAGCVMVLNSAWTDRPGSIWKPGRNCLSASSKDDLVKVLSESRKKLELKSLVEESHLLFQGHGPGEVGRRYLSFFKEHPFK